MWGWADPGEKVTVTLLRIPSSARRRTAISPSLVTGIETPWWGALYALLIGLAQAAYAASQSGGQLGPVEAEALAQLLDPATDASTCRLRHGSCSIQSGQVHIGECIISIKRGKLGCAVPAHTPTPNY